MVSSGQLRSTRCCGRRGPPAGLGGSPACVEHLGRVPGGLEGEIRILEAATEPPATGFGVGGGGAPFWASRRGTRHPDIGSRPFGAVFIWIRGRSCIDRSSSRGPLHARPAALCPPQSEERSDQIRGTGATRGPRRRKVPVMGSQAHGGHPAAASRPGTLSYKFITTKRETPVRRPPALVRAKCNYSEASTVVNLTLSFAPTTTLDGTLVL